MAKAVAPERTAPVTRPKSAERRSEWPGWLCPQPSTWTGGWRRVAARSAVVTMTATPPLETRQQSNKPERLGDPARGLVVFDRHRRAHLGQRVGQRPFPLGDGDVGELLARRSVREHVAAGGQGVHAVGA